MMTRKRALARGDAPLKQSGSWPARPRFDGGPGHAHSPQESVELAARQGVMSRETSLWRNGAGCWTADCAILAPRLSPSAWTDARGPPGFDNRRYRSQPAAPPNAASVPFRPGPSIQTLHLEVLGAATWFSTSWRNRVSRAWIWPMMP